MRLQEALDTLRGGGELPALSEAIGVVISDPTTSLEGIMFGLKHRGFVAEQAALTLYARTSRPLPDDRRFLVTDPDEWTRWLLAQPCRVNAQVGTVSSARDRLPAATAPARHGMTGRRPDTAPLPYLLMGGSTMCVFGGITFYAIRVGASWAATPIAVALACATVIGIIPLVQSFRLRASKSQGRIDVDVMAERPAENLFRLAGGLRKLGLSAKNTGQALREAGEQFKERQEQDIPLPPGQLRRSEQVQCLLERVSQVDAALTRLSALADRASENVRRAADEHIERSEKRAVAPKAYESGASDSVRALDREHSEFQATLRAHHEIAQMLSEFPGFLSPRRESDGSEN